MHSPAAEEENDYNESSSQKDVYVELIRAASNGDVNLCRELLSKGADVNYGENLYYPLMALCNTSKGKEEFLLECLELFVKAGVKINVTNAFNVSSLMMACEKNLRSIVERLLSLKVDLNVKDNTGWTALFYAVAGNNVEIVQTLLTAGAVVNTVDNRGRRPVDIAREKGFDDLAKTIIDSSSANDDDDTNVDDVYYNAQDALQEIRDGFPFVIYKLLRAMSMQRYFPKFQQARITLDVFLLMTNDDLRRVGVGFDNHRRRILCGVKLFLSHEWQWNFQHEDDTSDLVTALNVQCNLALHTIVLKSAIYRTADVAKETAEGRNADNTDAIEVFFDLIERELRGIHSRCRQIARRRRLNEFAADSCVDFVPATKTRSWYGRNKWQLLLSTLAIVAIGCMIQMML